jgi:hypothetical protein
MTVSTAFRIAVRSWFTAGVFFDKSPRFLEPKGIATPRFMLIFKE